MFHKDQITVIRTTSLRGLRTEFSLSRIFLFVKRLGGMQTTKIIHLVLKRTRGEKKVDGCLIKKTDISSKTASIVYVFYDQRGLFISFECIWKHLNTSFLACFSSQGLQSNDHYLKHPGSSFGSIKSNRSRTTPRELCEDRYVRPFNHLPSKWCLSVRYISPIVIISS